MRLVWKIVLTFVCIALAAGATFAWHVHSSRVRTARLEDDLRIYRSGAAQGDVEAEYNLARAYFAGWGVPRSYADAFLWYSRAADHGHVKAELGVGYMYQLGLGAPQDDAEAVLWYRRAADQGEPRAEELLGSLYYLGNGVPQSYAEALRWYRKAVDQGNARAMYDMAYMEDYGQGVAHDRADALRLYRMAARLGDDKALHATREGLSTFVKISLLVQLAGGLFLALGSVRIRLSYFAEQPQEPMTASRKRWAAVGWLVLFRTAYAWYGYTHLKFPYLRYGPNAWIVARWVLEAVAVALLLYALRLDRKRELEDNQ